MTFDEIEAFVQVTVAGGLTGAARALHRSQPAISRRIDELEQHVGVELFERVGRTIELTEAGRVLLPLAEMVLAAMRDFENTAAGLRSSPAVHIRVAIVGTLADTLVVDALKAFRSRFGPGALSLQTASSTHVSALVRRGAVDVGVRYHIEPDERLCTTQLGNERLLLVIPDSHPVKAGRVRDLRAFENDAWLAFPPRREEGPTGTHARLTRDLVAAGLRDPRFAFVDSLTAQKRLVEAGFGIALLPEPSIREEVERGRLRTIQVDNLNFVQAIVAVYRPSVVKPGQTELLDLLRDAAEGL